INKSFKSEVIKSKPVYEASLRDGDNLFTFKEQFSTGRILVVTCGSLLITGRNIGNLSFIFTRCFNIITTNHENLQQVHSIKSIRSKVKGESSKKPASNPSGLRKHHNRNTWVESLKLVFWSGTTWLMEIVGTLVTMYGGRSQGEWYNYLWYLPVGFNCLRGLGIFVIICFNDENKTKVLRTAKTLRISFFTTLGKFVPSLTQRKKSDGNDSYSNSTKKSRKRNTVQFSTKKTQDSKLIKPTKQRSTSVTTIMTNISSTNDFCTSEGDSNGENTLHVPSFFNSISQKKKRNNETVPNFITSEATFHNHSLEETKYDETLPNLFTKEATYHSNLEENKDDEKFLNKRRKIVNSLTKLFAKEETLHSHPSEEKKDDEIVSNLIIKEPAFHHPNLEEKMDDETSSNLITKEATLHLPSPGEKKNDNMVPDFITKEAQGAISNNESSA
ncbi:hypothetical protein Anas_14344, partial [Armadillidium nasatum]